MLTTIEARRRHLEDASGSDAEGSSCCSSEQSLGHCCNLHGGFHKLKGISGVLLEYIGRCSVSGFQD